MIIKFVKVWEIRFKPAQSKVVSHQFACCGLDQLSLFTSNERQRCAIITYRFSGFGAGVTDKPHVWLLLYDPQSCGS